MHQSKIYLMAAGTTPFIATCLCIYLLNTSLSVDLIKIISSYGLLIFSFICGSYWGLSMHSSKKSYYFISNLATLTAWSMYVMLDFKHYTLGLAIAFITLLLVDHHMYSCKLINKGYFISRIIITCIVSLSLALMSLSV